MIGIFLLVIGNFISQLPWTLAFLLLHHVGVRMYIIKNPDQCRQLQKRLSGQFSHSTPEGKGFGYAVGRWFFLSLDVISSDECGETCYAYIITTPATMTALLSETKQPRSNPKDNDHEPPDRTSTIRIFDRSGSYYHLYYRPREVEMKLPEPRPVQEGIMERVLNVYKKRRSCVAYIHGPPGAGKTIIGLLLANRMKGSYYNHFRPWEPAESIQLVYSEMEPSVECPLILAMDEIDDAIRIITSDNPPGHKRMPISVGSKSGWNKMMDEIHLGIFPHLIILLTSNVHADCINRIDSSLLRDGRVDLIIDIQRG